MSKQWRNILLSLSAATLLFAACNKKSSSDNPLTINATPSIIIGNDNYTVYALDLTNGHKNWEVSIHGNITASPLVYNGMVYIAASNGDTLYKINSVTGVITNKIILDPLSTFNISATPIADANLIYVAGTNGYLYAWDTIHAVTNWNYSGDGTPIYSSPTIYNGNIYFATIGGSIFCLNKTLGGTNVSTGVATPEVWTIYNLPNASFYSSPTVGNPYLFIGSTVDSNMYCVFTNVPAGSPAGTGVIRWTYKTKGPIYSSPAAYAGRCIFGCNDYRVYCLDTSINPNAVIPKLHPDSIWITATTGQVQSSPFAANQVVYIGSYDAFLYALNIINGGIKWQFKTRALIKSSPLLYNGTVYVGGYDGFLYAVDSALGNVKWQYNTNGLIESSPAVDNLTRAQINSQISGLTH